MSKVIYFQQVSVIYPNGKQALREVSFSISAGECLALVGESGCGKSTLARTALGILPPKTKVVGSIKVVGKEVIGATDNLLRNLRGLLVGFVAQDPFSACNPLASVGDFVSEAWRVHSLNPPPNVIEDSLENLGIENSSVKIRQFPHFWSGGMLQRAGIAAAAAHVPKIIIADEPTSSLDSELNQTVLESLKNTNSAILLISHDLRLVEKYADRLAVMRDGEIVEIGTAQEIFQSPQHQYTQELLSYTIFRRNEKPTVSAKTKTVLEAKNLGHFYGNNQLFDNVNLQIKSGEMIGICGASGCGKSTLLRLLMTIETPKKGEILMNQENSSAKKIRNGFVMPIFQDSSASLDRRWAIWRIITEPLTANHWKNRLSKNDRIEIAKQKLAEVGLDYVNIYSRPTELSIGQCQRIAIARALVANAKIIVADEPTSSLDALNCHQIMKLFAETAAKGTAIIIVSHDKKLLSRWCQRVYSLTLNGLETYQEK